MDIVFVGERRLTLKNFADVVWRGRHVSLSETAKNRVRICAEFVAQQVRSGKPIYGVTTGFGSNRDTFVAPEDAERMQENLVCSHACGVGNPLSESVVRGMMLLRITALVQGHSGIRLETLQLLVDMLNQGIHPVIPEHGSVGASGDLCPLAHMALSIIGQGTVHYRGQIMSSAEALQSVGLQPRTLTYKEGLALLNGTQAMTALGMVVICRFQRILDIADAACALTLDAVAGRTDAFDPRIHTLRGRDGQIKSAAKILRYVANSELAGAVAGTIEGKREYVQDSYSLRCAPQVHGACRDVCEHVKKVLVDEANAVTDNPLVFPENGDILSGGNFHGEPVAMALDYLKIAVAELGSISERRIAKLVDKSFNEGLPAFLVNEPGINSGHMIPQYVAAALVAESKVRSHPSSVDSIPTSANMEDHVSMGHHAGRHALEILELTEQILGIELMVAAQAIDLRAPLRPGPLMSKLHKQIREHVSFMKRDRFLAPDLAAMKAYVKTLCQFDSISPGVI